MLVAIWPGKPHFGSALALLSLHFSQFAAKSVSMPQERQQAGKQTNKRPTNSPRREERVIVRILQLQSIGQIDFGSVARVAVNSGGPATFNRDHFHIGAAVPRHLRAKFAQQQQQRQQQQKLELDLELDLDHLEGSFEAIV